MDGIQNPTNYFLQGLNAYQAGAGIAQQEQQRQTAMEQQQRAEKYKQMMVDLVNKPDADAEDWLKLQAMFPEQSKAIKEMSAQKNDAELKNETLNVMQTYMAAENAQKTGDWTNFKNFTGKLIEAYKNSGKESDAAGLKSVQEMADISPEAIPASLMQFLSAQMGPEEFRKFYREQQTAKAKATEGLKGRFQPATEKGPDGTIWAMNDKGEVTVKDITGNVLEGEEAKKAWLKSKEYGIQIAEDTNYSRETGKLTAQKGTKAEIAKEVKGAEKEASAQETRIQDIIDKGYSAAETTPILRRSLELMKEIKTGGFAGVKLKAKQYFGVQGADEAELSTNLARAALAKLRQNLGAQFTERENKMLQRVEAGIGKSTQGNIRILEQSLTVANNSAKRAIRRARARGDMETVDEIEALMNESLAPPSETPPAETRQVTATNPKTGQKIVFKNGQWFDFKTNQPVQ
jgi:hypothetical protein